MMQYAMAVCLLGNPNILSFYSTTDGAPLVTDLFPSFSKSFIMKKLSMAWDLGILEIIYPK